MMSIADAARLALGAALPRPVGVAAWSRGLAVFDSTERAPRVRIESLLRLESTLSFGWFATFSRIAFSTASLLSIEAAVLAAPAILMLSRYL